MDVALKLSELGADEIWPDYVSILVLMDVALK